MLTLILQRPSWKHLFTSLTVVKLILGFLVAASTSNAFIERGGLEVGKSLKASIKHPVICLCVTGNRCLVPDVRRVHCLSYKQHANICPPSHPGTATWYSGIYCSSCFSVRAAGLWLSCQAGIRRIALLSV